MPALAQTIAPRREREDQPAISELGEVVNIINQPPESSWAYTATWQRHSIVHEGWTSTVTLRVLGPQEAARVPDDARMPAREAVRRTTIVRAEEDWQEADEPSAMTLQAGELLQVVTVKKQSWAFGWALASPHRRGWFPITMTKKVEPCVGSLAVTPEEESELSAGATAALVELLRATPPPSAQPRFWDGELPAAVLESAQRGEQEHKDMFERMDALSKAEEAAAGIADAPEQEADLLEEENVPEDAYPLVVCKLTFAPPRGAGSALLALKVGDLVRVTSLLDTAMYHGFLDGKQDKSGWFPRRNVQVVEDPLDQKADSLPVHLGVPPLPQVPPSLLRRTG